MRVGLLHTALLAPFAEVAQSDDAFEKGLGQLHPLQVGPELDSVVVQIDASKLAPIEHLRAIQDFHAQLVWPERELRRQSDCLSDG
jgi:hypothetical protein